MDDRLLNPHRIDTQRFEDINLDDAVETLRQRERSLKIACSAFLVLAVMTIGFVAYGLWAGHVLGMMNGTMFVPIVLLGISLIWVLVAGNRHDEARSRLASPERRRRDLSGYPS